MFDKLWFLRIAMASVFLYHGINKNLFSFAKHFKLPHFIALAVIFAEIAGGLGYLVGGIYNNRVMGYTITQWASLAVIPVLLGAILMVHYKHGFSVMNNGYEFQFVLLMIALYLLF